MKTRTFTIAVLLVSTAIVFFACSTSPAPSPITLSTPSALGPPTAALSLAPNTPPSLPTIVFSPFPPVESPSPAVSAASTRTPTAPASSLNAPRQVILAKNQPGPDDLILAPDGTIYFSDLGDGTVKRLDQSGQVTVVISKLLEPEGLVFLPDGSLVLVEQGRNRLLRFNFTSKQLTPYLQLENRTGNPGVDNIIFDPKTQSILVPDSPNNRLLRVSADGMNVQVLAQGLARPTGAAVEADGNMLVADENGGDIRRVPANGGTSQVVAHMPLPDDVIVDSQGSIYANTLGEGAIHRIDPRTGRNEIFWGGLRNPQGIIFDGDGNLIVADAGNHQIIKIVMH